MAIETINVGTSANDGTGDTLRGSFIKCNDNFEQLVPYNGATENLDLGSNDLYTSSVITPSLNILDSLSGYSSNIVSNPLSGDWELYAPDSSGTIATEENVNTLITDAIDPINVALETKQNKLFSLQKANGIVSVTGTFSETQVFKQSFVMNDGNFGTNSYGLGFFLNVFSLFSKVGSLSGYTIRVKLSTSSTMPSGTTDQIAVFNGTTTNLCAQFIRNFSIIRPTSLGNMQLHGYPFTTSAINDFSVASLSPSSRDVLYYNTYYLYVSVQLTTTTSDTLNFISLKASNV